MQTAAAILVGTNVGSLLLALHFYRQMKRAHQAVRIYHALLKAVVHTNKRN